MSAWVSFRQGMCVDAASLTQVIRERTRKIRLAARSLFARRILLRQLVVSLFAWTGSWHRYTKAVLNHWSMLIETEVWGKQPASRRSRFLFWNSLGTPEIHPLFALQFATIRAEWRRQCRSGRQARAQGGFCATGLELVDFFRLHLDYT